MSENKNLRRRQKNRGTEQAVDVPKMASVNPGMRITGASKVLQDDHVHEALQNKSDEKTNAQASFYVSDEDVTFVNMSPIQFNNICYCNWWPIIYN